MSGARLGWLLRWAVEGWVVWMVLAGSRWAAAVLAAAILVRLHVQDRAVARAGEAKAEAARHAQDTVDARARLSRKAARRWEEDEV